MNELINTILKLIQSFTTTGNLHLFTQWLHYLEIAKKNHAEKIERVHIRKLDKLGIKIVSNTRTLVYNLSSKVLEEKVIQTLEKGPNFVFKPKKFLDFNDKVELENIISELKYNHKDNISDATLKEITSEIKTVSNHYFRNQSKFKNTSDDFNEILNLKSILKDESLVLLKSDKGNSLVILDTVKYFTFGHSFFSTESFEHSVNENEKNFNRLKTFLAELKNKKVITVQ